MDINAMRGLAEQKTRAGEVTSTPERLAKLPPEGVETLPPQPGHRAGQRILEGPLDQLHKRGELMRREFEAGEHFRADAYLSAINPLSWSVDWERAGGGGTSSFVPINLTADHVLAASQRHRQCQNRFGRTPVWRIAIIALVDERPLTAVGGEVFGYATERDQRVAGRAGFVMALQALADFYGS